jgi:hypothetical protein
MSAATIVWQILWCKSRLQLHRLSVHSLHLPVCGLKSSMCSTSHCSSLTAAQNHTHLFHANTRPAIASTRCLMPLQHMHQGSDM